MANYFSQVTIIGVGLLGGSMALALKKYHLVEKVIAVSRPETISKAVSLGVIDHGVPYDRIAEGIENSDVVFLTSPVSVILRQMEQLAKIIPDGVIVTDVGSTKKHIMENAERLFAGKKYFIGGHPMAGAEQAGVEKADADLYKNRPYVLIGSPGVPEAALDRFEYAIKCIGAKTVRISADEHDIITAAISHVPQIAAVALMNVIGRKDDEKGTYLRLAGGGFRDMTRIASSPYSIWEDICQTNKENIQKAIHQLIEELHDISNLIGSSELSNKFQKSAEYRQSLITQHPVE